MEEKSTAFLCILIYNTSDIRRVDFPHRAILQLSADIMWLSCDLVSTAPQQVKGSVPQDCTSLQMPVAGSRLWPILLTNLL
jgi:hypothetical protein